MTRSSPQESITPGSSDKTTEASATASAPAASCALDAAQILASVGEVAYDWHIDSDILLWGGNVTDVLLIRDTEALSTGRAYAQLLAAENAQARFDAVMQSDKHDNGHGVFYQIQYCIRPDPALETRLWVEDTGRWFGGPDGRPLRARGLVRVINERYEHERRLSYLARCDGLTGELNRHHLTEVLEDTIDDAMRFRSSCGFLLVAIDNLARINESYGFDIADQVIAEVAKRLRSRMRGKDTLGRFSGNKFGLVLRDCTPDDMAIAAERLLAGIRDEMVPTQRRADRGDRDHRRGDGAAPCPQRVGSARPRAGDARHRQRPGVAARSSPIGPISSARRCAGRTCAPPTRSSPRSTSGASFSPTRRWWRRRIGGRPSTSA